MQRTVPISPLNLSMHVDGHRGIYKCSIRNGVVLELDTMVDGPFITAHMVQGRDTRRKPPKIIVSKESSWHRQ
ncbi:unnamed protein product [Sphenostylis stenocarpa]|uniref:Uncharacterized protein n=1 Tax=Sphenostylis stenocarpa TaxID=92480 RepID=A0AA86W2K7_9FABA|nr:unnamed protein product [Sphenostylis stenocarpa]